MSNGGGSRQLNRADDGGTRSTSAPPRPRPAYENPNNSLAAHERARAQAEEAEAKYVRGADGKWVPKMHLVAVEGRAIAALKAKSQPKMASEEAAPQVASTMATFEAEDSAHVTNVAANVTDEQRRTLQAKLHDVTPQTAATVAATVAPSPAKKVTVLESAAGLNRKAEEPKQGIKPAPQAAAGKLMSDLDDFVVRMPPSEKKVGFGQAGKLQKFTSMGAIGAVAEIHERVSVGTKEDKEHCRMSTRRGSDFEHMHRMDRQSGDLVSKERAPRKPGRGGAAKKAMSQEEAAAVMQKLVRKRFSDHTIQRLKTWRRRRQHGDVDVSKVPTCGVKLVPVDESRTKGSGGAAALALASQNGVQDALGQAIFDLIKEGLATDPMRVLGEKLAAAAAKHDFSFAGEFHGECAVVVRLDGCPLHAPEPVKKKKAATGEARPPAPAAEPAVAEPVMATHVPSKVQVSRRPSMDQILMSPVGQAFTRQQSRR